MSKIDPLKLASAKAKGKRPHFFEDNDVERLTTIVATLVQEVAVMRERLDTVERVLDRKGTLTRADIETFEPTKPEAEERGAWTQEYLARIYRILQQEREALQTSDQYSEEVADELAKT